MSGGIVFDLWALAFAAFVAGIAGLVAYIRLHHRAKFHDYEIDWPEFSHSKEGHCKVVP